MTSAPALLLVFVVATLTAGANDGLAANRAPLASVKPQPWLKRQLLIRADEQTGHLDLFWPSQKQSATCCARLASWVMQSDSGAPLPQAP